MSTLNQNIDNVVKYQPDRTDSLPVIDQSQGASLAMEMAARRVATPPVEVPVAQMPPIMPVAN